MEFIQEYIIDTYVYLQLPPVLIGLFLWRRLAFEYKLFVVLLIYSVLNEVFKLYYGTYISLNQNKIFSNIYNAIYFGFLFWLFYKKSKNLIFRKIIIFISILYILSICYEIFFEQLNYSNQSQVIPYIIGGFGVFLCVFFYFSSLLRSDQTIDFSSDFLFWIAIAHFIYYLGFVPFKAGENYFAAFNKYLYLFNIKIPVTFLKSIILSLGLILCNRQKIQ